MLERDVGPGSLRRGEQLVGVAELRADVEAPAAVLDELRTDGELAVDVDRAPEPNRKLRGHRREAEPGRKEARRLVERRPDEPAVDEPGSGLVVLREREACLVRLDADLGGVRKVDPRRVVAAAPARGVVVWRNGCYRSPPRSKCALKKFSEPAVAIEADAEISSASVAAATICAKR